MPVRNIKILQLLLLLLVVSWNPVCLATYVTHPNIDLRSLEQLGISGSYKGISVYRDTEQLTQLPKSTSSVISFSNDTLKLIGTSNIDGTILDACIVNETLYFAGNFSTVNGQSMNHIASFDLTSKKLQPLKQGLDGIVYSLVCEAQQIYVGGSFIAPVDETVKYSDSLGTFGGSVAIWKDSTWHALPWKGLNGPVYSILKNSSMLIFGGQFDTTTDGQPYHAPASQPISIPTTGVSAVNTSTNSAPATSILCADASNTNPWLLTDGTTGTWQASFIDYSVNPVLIRVANSKLDNHQTKEFSIRSLSDSTVYELTYLDPDTNVTKTCSTNCMLSKDMNVGYQDFRITNISLSSGIAIDIKSWYGASGGLASVKVFQSEIFAYAVPVESSNFCAATTNTNLPKVVKTGGAWTNTTGAGAYSTITVTSSSTKPSATFYPNLAESGFYEVLVYTPACENCTTVDALVYATSNSIVAANTTINQQSSTSQVIYNGYFDVSSSFQPHITLTLGHNVTLNSGESATMIAHAVQFIKDVSLGGLTSILQYNSSDTKMTTKEAIGWSALKDNLPSQSVVKTMQLVDNHVLLAGNFSATDKSNVKYSNLVQYDMAANQLKSLTNGGLNGPVESMACISADCFVGGMFTLVSNGTLALNNIAQYNLQKATWTALEGGVDGAVNSVSVFNDHVLVSGNFSKNGTQGNAWWDIKTKQWIQDETMPFLDGIITSVQSYNNVDYYMGSMTNAQRYRSNGISFITSSSDITMLSPMSAFAPITNQSTVSSGVLFKSNITANNETRTTILGGIFSLSNNIQNVAIYNQGEWSGIEGTNWQGSVNSMAVENNLLYVGGEFSGSNINHLAVFNLTSKAPFLAPNLTTDDGTSAYVNTIRHVPSLNMMVIGGRFNSIDTAPCTSICGISTTNHSWTTLGSGLAGEVVDIQPINNSLIVASGNLTLDNSSLLIAKYDFKQNTWGPLGTADLPGPSRHIAFDNITQNLYIAGEANGSTFLRVWDGQQFMAPDSQLGPGSIIQQLTMLPVMDASAQNILLASGFLNLGTYGNVSAAFFDGKNWIPYLVTSGAQGSSSDVSLGSLFYLDQPYTIIAEIIQHFLPRPVVILIAIACSLGIVFSIASSAIAIIFLKRKRDRKIDPQEHPSTYYGKPPRSPESLLEALKQSSPPEDDDDDMNEDNAEKRPRTETEQETLYNLSKAISSDHLNEQAFGAAAMTTARPTPNTHSRQSSSHNFFYNTNNSPVPRKGSVASIGYGGQVALPAAAAAISNKFTSSARPESFARPYSEIQRDPQPEFLHNNDYTTKEMTEIPGRSYSPYNPFRNSVMSTNLDPFNGNTAALGVNATDGIVPAVNMATANHDKQNENTAQSIMTNKDNSTPQAVSYSNIPAAIPSTFHIDNQQQNVTYTNVPAATPSSYTVIQNNNV
ncbi:hypothetical protein CU098_005698 [Rhizopus stolonifer]|uniref:Uncharacterized protein n=1 Tax=Rhizopus stolonifer TaxID=4846 RepID=A0A367KNJ1_RHIST|nr:hypothetical protein CU098_005698 [Rhizopus stolonifer]